MHRGGWIGGSKEELAVYFRLIAREGYVVVAPRDSLAPETRYPSPVRQEMDVLSYVQSNAVRLGVDPTRLVLAGDSAGAAVHLPRAEDRLARVVGTGRSASGSLARAEGWRLALRRSRVAYALAFRACGGFS